MQDFDIRPLAERFRFEGRFASASEVLSGHINRTYRLRFTNPDGEYILQRINAHVFRRPEVVMDTSLKVTEHLRQLVSMGAPPERRVLEFVAAVGGGPLFVDGNGGTGARTATSAARAPTTWSKSGTFRRRAARSARVQAARGLPGLGASGDDPELPPHALALRRVRALRRRGQRRQTKNVRDEIHFFLDRRRAAHEIVGRDRLRVAHNDTGSNVLFDEESEKAISWAVTSGRGSAHQPFLSSAANTQHQLQACVSSSQLRGRESASSFWNSPLRHFFDQVTRRTHRRHACTRAGPPLPSANSNPAANRRRKPRAPLSTAHPSERAFSAQVLRDLQDIVHHDLGATGNARDPLHLLLAVRS